MGEKTIRIGGASGYWGESDVATPQLLASGKIDYLVFDYLAEVTMSIMARAKAADPNKGFAIDFVSSVLKGNMPEIARQGIKVISNAGGMNPHACADAIRKLVGELGLDLKVAVVAGDDFLPRLRDGSVSSLKEMFSGERLPDVATVMSANAYLGAFPIAEALNRGANIVVTGRCVDSAVTLAACIHEFGWTADDLNALAGGSLAGHVLECGPQATGGNFTDWREVRKDGADIGYPIAEISGDGSFVCTKPEGTGGLVNVGTVSEQIVYEIGDPQAYILPDVICDFSQVTVVQDGQDRVRVANAKGQPAPECYKASVTYLDGYRGQMMISFTGLEADEKVRFFSDIALGRARNKLRALNAADFTEVNLEVLGTETQFGSAARISAGAREVVGKFAFRHADEKAVELLIREVMGAALASPAGLTSVGGGKPKPSPVVRLFSCLVAKEALPVTIDFGEGPVVVDVPKGAPFDTGTLQRPEDPAVAPTGETVELRLIDLAWGRSGDKGDKANIGIIARRAEYLPYIAHALTEKAVSDRFAHFLKGRVERYVLPGANALNFLLHDALGGGGMASLRNDPQGKSYAQILLDHPVTIPREMAEKI